MLQRDMDQKIASDAPFESPFLGLFAGGVFAAGTAGSRIFVVSQIEA